MYDEIDKIAGIDCQLLVDTQTCTHCRKGENCQNCIIRAVADFHGAMLSTLDSESSDPSPNLGGTRKRLTRFLCNLGAE